VIISTVCTAKGFDYSRVFLIDLDYISIRESFRKNSELMALVWSGRGDLGVKAKDWDKLVGEAKDDENTADYLLGKDPLAEYLDKGLAKLEGRM
jgi:hypothetical protein